MADWMALVLSAVFFFAVLFIYFQFVGPATSSLLGTTTAASPPGT